MTVNAETSTGVYQVTSEILGADPDDYIFTDGAEPPRFAVVSIYQVNQNHTDYIADGPFDQGQLKIYFKDGDLTEQELGERDARVCTHAIEGLSEVKISGHYPGGASRAALNLARLILAEA